MTDARRRADQHGLAAHHANGLFRTGARAATGADAAIGIHHRMQGGGLGQTGLLCIGQRLQAGLLGATPSPQIDQDGQQHRYAVGQIQQQVGIVHGADSSNAGTRRLLRIRKLHHLNALTASFS